MNKYSTEENKWALDEEDDAPLFWFAMADIQWLQVLTKRSLFAMMYIH